MNTSCKAREYKFDVDQSKKKKSNCWSKWKYWKSGRVAANIMVWSSGRCVGTAETYLLDFMKKFVKPNKFSDVRKNVLKSP